MSTLGALSDRHWVYYEFKGKLFWGVVKKSNPGVRAGVLVCRDRLGVGRGGGKGRRGGSEIDLITKSRIFQMNAKVLFNCSIRKVESELNVQRKASFSNEVRTVCPGH